ncbi:MAG TPA: hydrogenase maturation nickel metallochaperone HypA [Thermodesulfovibrionales bacterium]|nr:hydrogenase maturation nickel metallochaperone HypA [Thermodesulfovibrionales bacterium]
MPARKLTRKRKRGWLRNKMHEVSIAQSLLKIAVENCEKNGYKRIEAIKVKVGRASGIMPDALLFAFDAVKIGSIADKASLNIEDIPVSGFCESCNKNFTVDEAFVINCPICGNISIRMETGRELHIEEMDVF